MSTYTERRRCRVLLWLRRAENGVRVKLVRVEWSRIRSSCIVQSGRPSCSSNQSNTPASEARGSESAAVAVLFRFHPSILRDRTPLPHLELLVSHFC